ncbi:hypothetical protein AB0F30_25575 [Streptomyces sp. NPDC029006]|uniref:hypothetical protein n=1 Tax=Streptomyces sp. NPDC029006 TaxID=3155467 RepID=UPI003404665C
MSWGTLRSWWMVSGLVLVVAALTAGPLVVKTAHVGGPVWLVPVITVAAGVMLGVWKPLLAARSDALAARTRDRAGQEALAAAVLETLPTRKGRIPRVEEVTSRAVLNIHEAIPLRAGTVAGLSADLPKYVPRDTDAALRDFLTRQSTSGGFALLVGPAAAGKTRTAYEAVRQVLPRWRMLMPATGAELNALVAGGSDLARSVIWLNETQDFLTGPDPLTAVTVRRLLADDAHPVVLVGTIWPDRHTLLRAAPPLPAGGSGSEDGEAGGTAQAMDMKRNSRDVLAQARLFTVAAFSDREWERAEELATCDPRLAQAVRHRGEGLGLPQILSAAPELVQRWELADSPYGKAVLTAAVTARRCGHPDTLPAAVLKALTEDFLTGSQRAGAAPNWYEDALAWACLPVHPTTDIAPLRPHAQAVGHIDGHRVSDILTHHAAPTTPAGTPDSVPDEVWETLIREATPAACHAIGYVASDARRPALAAAAWTRAAVDGNTEAMSNLGVLMAQMGLTDIARTWWTQAADHGNTDAMHNLGVFRFRQGDTGTARTWWVRAANGGHPFAMSALIRLLEQQGDQVAAARWRARLPPGENPPGA